LSDILLNFGQFFYSNFKERAPKFWDLVLKITTISDVAKFCGDQPRDLGYYALKNQRKKNRKT